MTSLRVRPARAAAVATLGAAALLTAACGGGSSSSTSSSAAASSAAPAASSAPASSAAAATTAAAASNLPKTIVFSPLTLAAPALKGLSEGLKGYASSKGWEVIVQDGGLDPNKQTQQLTEVISSGRVGAAWVIAVAPKSMGPVLKLAQDKGVPMLVNGRPDEYGFTGAQPGVTFDYIDYKATSTPVGEQMGKCINEKLGGKAKIIWSVSTEGTAGKKEGEDATLAALKAAAPGAEIVQQFIGKDRAQSQTDVQTILQGNPGANALMSTQDEGTLGGLGAFAAAGKTATCVVGFGGNDEVLAGVKSGKIYSAVALQFAADMAQSFDTLAKMQADPKAAGPILTVPFKVITKNG